MFCLKLLLNTKQLYKPVAFISKSLLSSAKNHSAVVTEMEAKVVKDILVAFDFDHTLVDSNSDTVARSLLSERNIDYSPAEKIYKDTDSWTYYMRKIFGILHENSISGDQIVNAIQRIPPVTGMLELLNYLNQLGDRCEIIIISDSNSIFIDEWLKHTNLSNIVSKVFTNPAFFDSTGLLNIEPFHTQDFCKLSEWNLCKGHVLNMYINDRKSESCNFKHLAYVGDGANDLCPSLRLSEGDFVFPRANYSLSRKLSQHKSDIKADIYAWTTGNDIVNVLQQKLS